MCSRTGRAGYALLAPSILLWLALAGCGQNRPDSAVEREFAGMWDYPRVGLWERSDSQLEGTLTIEGDCVLVIESYSEQRTLVSLPRSLPVFERGERSTGIEDAKGWMSTVYDAEAKSLWVGEGGQVRVGDHVSLSGHPIDSDWFDGECAADSYWRAGSLELWP